MTIGIGVAVFQYVFFKKDSGQKNEREQIILTSNLIVSFYEDIYHKYGRFINDLRNGNKLYSIPTGIYAINFGDEKLKADCSSYLNQLSPDELAELGNIRNFLERFAVPLYHNLANKEIARLSVGHYYLEFFRWTLPIFFSRSEPDANAYMEMVKLYNEWNIHEAEAAIAIAKSGAKPSVKELK